jgi:hypothetical protein
VAANAASWSVEYQQESVDLGSDGKAVQGVKVGFKTSHGVHASVFVPRAEFTPDKVKAKIADAVAQIDGVHNLTGTV